MYNAGIWRALAAGALISVLCFALLFWAAGHFLVQLPQIEASSWFRPVTNAAVMLALASGVLIHRRKQRRGKKAAHR
jgi:membrane protein DedA with SNARE-associated domain